MSKDGRLVNESGLDLDNLKAIREAVADAKDVGHWRRLLAIFGDHLPACAARNKGDNSCDCGWNDATAP